MKNCILVYKTTGQGWEAGGEWRGVEGGRKFFLSRRKADPQGFALVVVGAGRKKLPKEGALGAPLKNLGSGLHITSGLQT